MYKLTVLHSPQKLLERCGRWFNCTDVKCSRWQRKSKFTWSGHALIRLQRAHKLISFAYVWVVGHSVEQQRLKLMTWAVVLTGSHLLMWGTKVCQLTETGKERYSVLLSQKPAHGGRKIPTNGNISRVVRTHVQRCFVPPKSCAALLSRRNGVGLLRPMARR